MEKLIKKLLNKNNQNKNINFYETFGDKNDMIFVDIPSDLDSIFTNNYIKKIDKNLLINLIVLDCQILISKLLQFYNKKIEMRKNFNNLLLLLIKQEIKKKIIIL